MAYPPESDRGCDGPVMPALLVGRLWAPGARRDGSADRSAIRAGRDEPAGFGKLPHSTIAGSRAGPIRYSPATPSVFRSEYGGGPKRKNQPSTRKGPPGGLHWIRAGRTSRDS